MTPRVTLESLAAMVKEGFEHSAKDMSEFRAEVRSDIERIDLHLTQAAYRFELVELEHRVVNIERQIGIPRV
jgi:hypothetical protein